MNYTYEAYFRDIKKTIEVNRKKDLIALNTPLVFIVSEILPHNYRTVCYYSLRYNNEGKAIFKRISGGAMTVYMMPINNKRRMFNDLNDYEKSLLLLENT